MSTCPSCSSDLPAGSRFCPSCGASLLDASATPTVASAGSPRRTERRTPTPVPAGPGSPAGSDAPGPPGSRVRRRGATGEARFIPGAVMAGRYRIVGLLGKGGMGEVYRADDMKLGQPVALKLLPDRLASDERFLERFYSEVRVARQVSHPNVCRVYDVGEADGLHYISMEYIDGEDLGSLLRRIGRLPGDKAVEISRQICAGLAAAHDKGVLHRDLKPANVMIDGRGHARIADFGLAGAAGEIQGREIRSGTPAYMAPEQLAGREVSVLSDVYSLGLVLYELFTGKRAFEAESLDQLRALRESSAVTSPSSHVQEMDPAVERVILRCLDQEPAQRPPSPLAVAAALPGGDPLAAALAAGETPSPEMVAAAGEEGAVGALAAWGAFGAFVVLLALVGLLARWSTFFSFAPVEKSPQVLADRARVLLEKLGHEVPPADTAHGYSINSSYVGWIARNDPSPGRWEQLKAGRPAGSTFWYRESPRSLSPYNGVGNIWWGDPPETVSGMAAVSTDTLGRLRQLSVVPPQVEATEDGDEPAAAGSGPADWAPLFAAAELDPDAFREAAPSWTPPVYADHRAAWTGAFPELPGTEISIEAASRDGRPVYFEIVGPWTRAVRMQAFNPGIGPIIGQAIFVVFFISVVASGVIMARRNVRLGRGDRQGAFRIGVYLFTGTLVMEMVQASHVADVGDEFNMITRLAGLALFTAGFVWLLYLAIEPLVRRSWPEGIISWTRLLAGKLRDPLVGRDILAGSVAGAALMVLDRLYHVVPGWLGAVSPIPHYESRISLLGAGQALARLYETHLNNILFAMLLMFFFYLGAIRGRNLVGAGIFFTIYGIMDTLFRGEPWMSGIILSAFNALIVTVVYYRFGLLSATVALMLEGYRVPITLDPGVWYAGQVLMPLLVLIALSAYGAWTAQGRRAGIPARAVVRAPVAAGRS